MTTQEIFDAYKKAVKAQYEESKTGDYAALLRNPSPALLKKHCMMLLEKGLDKQDDTIFRIFFHVAEDGNLGKAIDNFGNGKMKSLQFFLMGENSDHQARIDLAAVIVNFKPRPFQKFAKGYDPGNVSFQKVPQGQSCSPGKERGLDVAATENREKKKGVHPFVIAALVVVGVLFAAFIAGDLMSANKCMQWQQDHYEVVPCEANGIGSFSDIEPFDEKKSELKKIEVCDTTEFFRNNIAKVWYISNKGEYEYYNAAGDHTHPVTGKAMSPITWYMINKHILKTQQ